MRQSRPFLIVVAFICGVAMVTPAAARGLLRDAGLEHALNMLARPLLTAAGLPASRTTVLVVDDMSMNAFVVDNSHVFINSGLLLRLKTAAQVQAVLAHEIAHIANGHFARRALNRQSSRTLTGIGVALAVAAGAASGNPGLGAGLAIGGASSSQRLLFAHTRAEEASADQAGMRYLASAGIDPHAMIEVLEIFEGQDAINVAGIDPYAVSHPMTRDRMRAAKEYADAVTPRAADQQEIEYWFARERGKLSAYLRDPGYTLNRLSAADQSDAALVERSVALFRMPDLGHARATVAELIARRPDDPYLHDLSGWIELDSGQVDPAIAAYARAVDLAPREPMILAGYGRALIAKDTPQSRQQARAVLERARAIDPFDARMLRDLSIAYAKLGEDGMASLATAERLAFQGDLGDAAVHARRAAGVLPMGSPAWARAQDILQAAEAQKKRR